MSEEAVKRIPYGLSDYEKIRKGNYYYVDKTGYLRDIERAGDYLFFIRPRRFGKSLFVSMIETYYDVARKDQFDFFFDGTDILRRPTPQRSGFLILTFNFSAVAPAPGHVERSFFDYVVEVADRFLFKYKDRLTLHDPHQYTDELKQKATASDVLRSLIGLCEKSGQQLYLIIDEYDNFANTILSTSGSGDYWDLTHGESFFRTFFNVIKSGTTGSGAALSRLFITGVSPITMDDLTSGFNIGKSISTDADFNPMLGFTHDDVTAMIDYYRQAGRIRHQTHDLLELMKQWYNHYVFSRKASTPLFNADMVLYFLDEYFKEHDLPEELVDRNVRIDYDKLRHLITVDKRGQKEVNGNFLKLREIVEEGKARSKLVKGFPLEEMDSSENFVSLLFYLGLLTISGEEEGLVQFQIPNRTAKALYYDYIIRVGNETGRQRWPG